MKRLKKMWLETKRGWPELLGIILAFIGIFNMASGLWYIKLLAYAAFIVGLRLAWKYGMPRNIDDDPKNW